MDRDTKSSIWSCQIIAEKRIDKGAWKRATNRNMDNCVYNWDCDRKKVKFATMNAVKFVTAHEVINRNKIWHGKLAGKLLVDVLEADFMEAM